MPKTENKKTYTPVITKRFLLIMDEVVKEGKCDTEAEFMESIGEHRTNLTAYLKGTRSPHWSSWQPPVLNMATHQPGPSWAKVIRS